MPCSIVMLNCNYRLCQRQIALIELGMIESPEDLPAFAQSLYGYSLLLELYSHANKPKF
jgi:hypothetical protein